MESIKSMNSNHKNVHKIDLAYIKHEIIGSIIGSIIVSLAIYGLGWFIIAIAREDGSNLNEAKLWKVIFWVIIGFVTLSNGITWIFAVLYVKNFSYEFTEKFIIIRYGVLTKTKTTIPYSRIQNVAIYQNIRDRILKLYKVKIETAGSSAATANAHKGIIRPEGYIPGVKNPTEIEVKINKFVHKYTQDSPKSGLSDVFTDNNIVFDEFIAYFLSKMREKDQIKTKIRQLREQMGLSISQLADAVGVAESTIKYLETGEFVPSLTLAMRIARKFNVSIEEIFELEK
ncbi:PH domain-containing protein [Candidatus Harpocratesius sp.]